MNYVDGGQTRVNNDSVGFWYHEDTQSLVVGFRGTDTADPERFLGFIPEDFKEKLDQTMEEMNPDDEFTLFKKNYLIIQLVHVLNQFCVSPN